MNQPSLNRAFYLPRLPREYYQGDAVVYDDPPGNTVSTYEALTQLFAKRNASY